LSYPQTSSIWCNFITISGFSLPPSLTICSIFRPVGCWGTRLHQLWLKYYWQFVLKV